MHVLEDVVCLLPNVRFQIFLFSFNHFSWRFSFLCYFFTTQSLEFRTPLGFQGALLSLILPIAGRFRCVNHSCLMMFASFNAINVTWLFYPPPLVTRPNARETMSTKGIELWPCAVSTCLPSVHHGGRFLRRHGKDSRWVGEYPQCAIRIVYWSLSFCGKYAS